MKINELVCRPDGTQEMQEREVPDDFFASPTPEPQPPSAVDVAEALIDIDTRVSMLEMGVK